MNRNATATILLVLAIGIYFTVTQSAWTAAQSIKAENDKYSLALEKATKLITETDSAWGKYQSIPVENRTKLDKMIPNTVDNIRLTIDLTDMAKNKLGLVLKNVKASTDITQSNSSASNPSASKGNDGIPTLDTVKVGFTVACNYNQFISLLQYLESNLRVMDVTHLSVISNDNGTYDFSVQLNTYWLRQ